MFNLDLTKVKYSFKLDHQIIDHSFKLDLITKITWDNHCQRFSLQSGVVKSMPIAKKKVKSLKVSLYSLYISYIRCPHVTIFFFCRFCFLQHNQRRNRRISGQAWSDLCPRLGRNRCSGKNVQVMLLFSSSRTSIRSQKQCAQVACVETKKPSRLTVAYIGPFLCVKFPV